MPFLKLVGNEPAKAALLRMVLQKSVPNTLLFYGPDGVGKSLFALALAELLMGPAHASRIHSKNHPDLHIYLPEGKSAIHPVDTIRRMNGEAALAPFEAPVKVFIIHDAHQMLPYSSNALLKLFEEPSLDAYFILLTDSPDAMLPTLVSRSRKIPFFFVSGALMEPAIQEQWKKTPAEARRLAFLSHGSFSKAQQLSQDHQTPWRGRLLELLSLRFPVDYPECLKLLLELEQECEEKSSGEEGSLAHFGDVLLEEIAMWYRDVELLREGIAPEYLYHLDCMDRLQLALSLPAVPLERVLDEVARARLALARTIKLRTVLEHFFLNIN
jgi:DNA polymerase III subunit delta'